MSSETKRHLQRCEAHIKEFNARIAAVESSTPGYPMSLIVERNDMAIMIPLTYDTAHNICDAILFIAYEIEDKK